MRKAVFRLTVIVLSLIPLSFFLITGCQREIGNPVAGTITHSVTDIDNEKVNAGVRGVVIDENNRPVMGATVSSNANTTTTDRYGVFHFSNISLSKANGYVNVTKAGYFTGSRSFISVAGRIHNVRIKLLPKTNAGNFLGSAGGTITLSGGGKLVMPAAAITDAGGNAYTGTVNVSMTWIDPSSPNLPDIVPGDLRGITTSGEERGLVTYGMLGVELTGAGGQQLKVAAGKTAELSFPIPAALVGSAPTTIDLWNFDETKARWKQEGQATKNGNFYIAQVAHFSFWNCDAQFPLINLCMNLVCGVENNPLNNVQVRIKRVVNNSYGYGRTDSAGNLCGKVPKDEALVLEVLDQCGNVAYSQNIGPFSNDATLPTVSVLIPAVNKLTITGTLVNCSNGNVTNGAVVLYTSGAHSYSIPVTNGSFSLTLMRCNGGTLNFTLLGVDYTTVQQGNPLGGSGTTGTVNVGTIQACGTSSSQYIEFLIDGSPVNYATPPDEIFMSDSLANPPYTNKPSIYTLRPNSGGTTTYSSFTFSSNASPGVYPLLNCFINAGPNNIAQQIITANPTVNVTTFGPPVTGFIEGNFNVQLNFSGTPKNVICNFRVRRN